MNNHYETVTTFRHMEQFGITELTREACAHGMRALCDVNEAGKNLLASFFGIDGLMLNKNWNQKVYGLPAVGSIMLTSEILPKLAQFAFFAQGALAVAIVNDREVTGIFDENRLAEYHAYRKSLGETATNFMLVPNHVLKSNAPTFGSRNIHQATGRAQ